MRVNSEAQARTQPVRERPTPPPAKERALKAPEKPAEKAPEPPKAQGHLGRTLDTKA